MHKHTAIYIRVSSANQSTRSQQPDLQRWIDAQDPDTPVKFYVDKVSGKTMNLKSIVLSSILAATVCFSTSCTKKNNQP